MGWKEKRKRMEREAWALSFLLTGFLAAIVFIVISIEEKGRVDGNKNSAKIKYEKKETLKYGNGRPVR